MADDPRVSELEDKLLSLTARVAKLEGELTAARGRFETTMKTRIRCPGCGHRKIIHIDRVLADPMYGEKVSSALAPVSERSFWGTTKGISAFEVFACVSCGLAEWHITEPSDAASRLRVIDGEGPDPSGPFR